ncbi:unnamed protein product [Closterium sp. NIES-53]
MTSYRFHFLLFFIADVPEQLNILYQAFQHKERTTSHIESRYVDCGDDFGVGVSERLSPFLACHGPGGNREVTAKGVDSDARLALFEFKLHEDTLEEFKGPANHNGCVDVCTEFAEKIDHELVSRLGDLKGMSGAKLFTLDEWPLERGERNMRCLQWLDSLVTLFKADECEEILPAHPAPPAPPIIVINGQPVLHLLPRDYSAFDAYISEPERSGDDEPGPGLSPRWGDAEDCQYDESATGAEDDVEWWAADSLLEDLPVPKWKSWKGELEGAHGARKRLHGRGRASWYRDMEIEVYSRVLSHRKKCLAVSVGRLQKWSHDVMKILHPEVKWAGSQRWTERFRRRWNLTTRAKTRIGQKLSSGESVFVLSLSFMAANDLRGSNFLLLFVSPTLPLQSVRHRFGVRSRKVILVLDSYREHLTDAVKAKFGELNIVPAVIPAGCTSEIQPLDVMVNRSFKAAVRQLYQEWFESEGVDCKTERGEINPYVYDVSALDYFHLVLIAELGDLMCMSLMEYEPNREEIVGIWRSYKKRKPHSNAPITGGKQQSRQGKEPLEEEMVVVDPGDDDACGCDDGFNE